MQCPKHGFEHFRVKVVRRLNISSDEIRPKVRRRPRPGEISCLYVGRNVSYEEAKNYLLDYYREKNVGEILRVRMLF